MKIENLMFSSPEGHLHCQMGYSYIRRGFLTQKALFKPERLFYLPCCGGGAAETPFPPSDGKAATWGGLRPVPTSARPAAANVFAVISGGTIGETKASEVGAVRPAPEQSSVAGHCKRLNHISGVGRTNHQTSDRAKPDQTQNEAGSISLRCL